MAKSIGNLNVGEQYTFKFHGSRQLGNEPYELDLYFQGINGSGDNRRAFLSDGKDGEGTFEVYIYNKRWAYGTSAERITVVKQSD